MVKKSQITIGKLQTFLDSVAKIRREWRRSDKPQRKLDEKGLWFRGQQCAEWGLSPKLYRPEYKNAQEAEIRFQFQSRAIQLVHGRLPATSWEWYFLMQHYGCPTRLLDWTDNPLIGLFFALEQASGKCAIHDKENCDRAIWVLDPWRLNTRAFRGKIDGPILSDWDEAKPYLLDLEDAFFRAKNTDFKGRTYAAAIDPPHIDVRLAAQGSHFVIFAEERDLTKVPYKWTTQIVVRSAEVDDIRAELEQCGINIATVFPDVHHLGEFIRRLARRSD
jgi:hypothetical protein